MVAPRRARKDAGFRVPASSGARSEEPPRSDRPVLRLALAKGHLAMELEAPYSIGAFSVEELRVLLPEVRFPVDLTGGVAKFRHRRGALERMRLAADASALARIVAPRITGLIGAGNAPPNVVIAPTIGGALVGVASGAAALAFDLLVAPMGGDVRLLIAAPRGIGLGAPPFVVAMRALGAAFKGAGEVRRGVMVLRDVGTLVGRHLMPAAGARVPSALGVEIDLDSVFASRKLGLLLEKDRAPPILGPHAMGALELAEIAGDADDIALQGDLDLARARYVAALERAPRHPDLTVRVASIDLAAGGRHEGALAVLVDAMAALDAGVLGGELLEAVGDRDGAFAALRRAASVEPFGPLAALAWLQAAAVAPLPELSEEAIDHALVRAPGMAFARWQRLAHRLARGDTRGALGDAEHLEADAASAEARVAVCMRAGALFADSGHLKEARSRFERALRYRPENAAAVLALARSLRDLGQGARALDLFARASALAERAPEVAGEADLELARALVDVGQNLPAAIARAARVPPDGVVGLEARALEARLRATMGDATGASRVLGRLRALAEAFPKGSVEAPKAAHWLLDAAAVEEADLGDLAAARECAALAVRLAPTLGKAQSELRRLSRLVISAAEHRGREPHDERDEPPLRTDERAPFVPPIDEGAREAKIEQLTSRLRADPGDAKTAKELAKLLEQAGRDLELLSLLSARIDEAEDAVRPDLEVERRHVIARLAEKARAEGRTSEADLYDSMLGTGA